MLEAATENQANAARSVGRRAGCRSRPGGLVRSLTSLRLFAPEAGCRRARFRERLRHLPYGVTGGTFGDDALAERRRLRRTSINECPAHHMTRTVTRSGGRLIEELTVGQLAEEVVDVTRGTITVDPRRADEPGNQVIARRPFGERLPEGCGGFVRAEIGGRLEVDGDHLAVHAAPFEPLAASRRARIGSVCLPESEAASPVSGRLSQRPSFGFKPPRKGNCLLPPGQG